MPAKLLIIAFHYPPMLGSSGIQRTLKFSTYLRDHDWEPMILSAAPRAYDQVSDNQMKEIPQGMLVERAAGFNTATHLSLGGRYSQLMAQPDRWVTWWPAAVWRGMRMIRKHRPVAIMSTYPIATAHLIGLTLQRLSGLPWIADCRDSMTEPGYPADPLTWKTNRWLESAMVGRCSKAVFTTQGSLEMYAERYPDVPAQRWAVIENGYDEENFRDAESSAPATATAATPGRVTLLHSGILYPLERDPQPFFSALQTLKAAGAIDAAGLRVRLRASGSEDIYRTLLAKHGIEDIVELAPPVSYKAALQEMLTADGLLLFQGTVCNHQVPAKLYEYLRAGRPVFTLTDPVGNTADVLRRAGADNLVDIADAHAIALALSRFLANVREGTSRVATRGAAELNSRRARSAELALLLNDVVARA